MKTLALGILFAGVSLISQPSALAADNYFTQHNIANHLEMGLTVGTTGVGLELATPITKWARLRAGYDIAPRFKMDSHFDVMTYGGDQFNQNDFDRARQLMRDFSGYELDPSVKMENTLTFQNWKVLLDIFPIPDNNHWRFTFGLYGGSRKLGKTINAMDEMTTLVTIGSYNNLYDQVAAPDFVEKCLDEKFLGLFYLEYEAAQKLQEKMLEYGRFGIHVGDFKDGTPYMMEPDRNATVSAKALINRLRPYVGVGYEGSMDKNQRWKVGVDAGVMFWGGTPKVVTHDGTLLNDLDHMRGDVQHYMDLMKAFPVWPTLNCRISYAFF